MSDYKITIHCPDCGQGDGLAHDDYFGKHHYGYRCNQCEKVYDAKDCESVLIPQAGARYMANQPRKRDEKA